MFTSFINKVVFHAAFAAGYSCNKTATGLRVAADKLDVAAAKCGSVALKHGREAGLIPATEVATTK